MGFFSRKGSTAVDAVPRGKRSNATSTTQTAVGTPMNASNTSLEKAAREAADANVAAGAKAADVEALPITGIAIWLGAIASCGGFIFGYESGQIGGMSCLERFSRELQLTFCQGSCK